MPGAAPRAGWSGQSARTSRRLPAHPRLLQKAPKSHWPRSALHLSYTAVSGNQRKSGRMGQFGMGQPVRRLEDHRLVTGHGRYTDDINLARQVYLHVLRSPHAHARIGRLDTAEAAAAPGVLAVFTAADLARDGIGTIPFLTPLPNRDGSPCKAMPYPVLAADVVRHAGDAVAVIVAETSAQARDAGELVAVDYETLPAAVNTLAALEPGQPLVWDAAPGNLPLDWEIGDKAATDKAFATAKHVVALRLGNNRLVANSLETRHAIGDCNI